MKYLDKIKKFVIHPICIQVIFLILFISIYLILHRILNVLEVPSNLSNILTEFKRLLETFIIIIFLGTLIGLIAELRKADTLLLYRKIYEEFVIILILSLMLYIFEKEGKLTVFILAVSVILYSFIVLRTGDRAIFGIIREKYEEKFKKIPYVDETNKIFKDALKAAIFSMYLQRQKEEIIESVRAPDDLLDEFNPCTGKPNLFDYISPENEEHRKIIEKVIIDVMNKDRVLKILRKKRSKWSSEDREKLSEVFMELARNTENKDPHLASYCRQLAKCVYWRKFYDLIEDNLINEKECFSIGDEKNHHLCYPKDSLIKRYMTTEDQNVLGDIIEVEKDDDTFYHKIEFKDYPNIHLLNNKYIKVETSSKQPKAIIFAPQFKEFSASYGQLWITKEAVNKRVLEYMMTLGGAYLLNSDWFPLEVHEKNNELPKFYLQHPFQEKVVIEVLNHQNYTYPSEIIKNWKRWMTSNVKNKERRFIWIREGVQPVANKIKITKDTKDIVDHLKVHYNNIGIKLEEEFITKLDSLEDSDNSYLLFFQIHEQCVRTPTTAILIITAEEEDSHSKLFELTEEFAKGQEDLKKIFNGLKEGILELCGYEELWKEGVDFKLWLSEPENWMKRGILGIIWREVMCCYALLKIINYYLKSEQYQEKLTYRKREDLKLSKEEIYDFLEFEYLDWLEKAIETISSHNKDIEKLVGNGKVQEFLTEIKSILTKLINVNSYAFIEDDNLRERIEGIISIINKGLEKGGK